jgi:tRNA U34 2-thiouridine synthase MnmA/TrmU
MRKGKGVLLYSGGLDSLLAAKILLDQGLEMTGLHCILPFDPPDSDPEESLPSQLADQIGLKLEYYRCGREFLEMVKNPPHGYGKKMNPCIDCKIHFISKAADLMREKGADFVATGEVVGQRPMSQQKHMMNHILKVTGLQGRLLRPLSAKILKPTVPEEEGLVDREGLYDISGRSRKRQLELAREFGLDDFSWPAGGCLFTDTFISRRVKDLLDHHRDETPLDYFLLTVGRHIRVSKKAKIIVSKNEAENNVLEKYCDFSDLFFIPAFRGPCVYGKGEFSQEDIALTVSILSRYGKPESGKRVLLYRKGEEERSIEPGQPADDNKINSMRI